MKCPLDMKKLGQMKLNLKYKKETTESSKVINAIYLLFSEVEARQSGGC